MGKLGLAALALVVGKMDAAGPFSGGASAQLPAAPRLGEIPGKAGHGCPYGAVCIYPRPRTWKTGTERNGIFYSYGAHNLHHQFRCHLVYNNQYKVNGAIAGFTFCSGYKARAA